MPSRNPPTNPLVTTMFFFTNSVDWRKENMSRFNARSMALIQKPFISWFARNVSLSFKTVFENQNKATHETLGSHLVYKCVQLWTCLLGALLQLFLSYVHILLYSLPVHLDVSSIVSYLEKESEKSKMDDTQNDFPSVDWFKSDLIIEEYLQQQKTSPYSCCCHFAHFLEEISCTPKLNRRLCMKVNPA